MRQVLVSLGGYLLLSAVLSAAPCTPSPTTLCLNDSRFEVEVSWRDSRDRTGDGQAKSITADTGYFWFFSETNIELVIKVLDARSINQKYWVFFGALTSASTFGVLLFEARLDRHRLQIDAVLREQRLLDIQYASRWRVFGPLELLIQNLFQPFRLADEEGHSDGAHIQPVLFLDLDRDRPFPHAAKQPVEQIHDASL